MCRRCAAAGLEQPSTHNTNTPYIGFSDAAAVRSAVHVVECMPFSRSVSLCFGETRWGAAIACAVKDPWRRGETDHPAVRSHSQTSKSPKKNGARGKRAESRVAALPPVPSQAGYCNSILVSPPTGSNPLFRRNRRGVHLV